MKKISAQSGSALGGKNKNKFRKKILASAYCSLFLMCVFLIFSSSIAHASATVDTNSQCANSGGTFVPNALTVPCQNCPSGKVTGAGGGYICQTPADFAASTSSTSPAADVYSATAGTASQGQTLFSSSTPTQFTYTLLESLPGFYSANTPMTDLPGLILAIYKFGIWTVGIAGLFMLVVGGIMYMSSAGNTSTASSAQGIITDALIGIVAALGAYLILYVINPDFTKINLNFTPVAVQDGVDFGGTDASYTASATSGGCIKPVNQMISEKNANWVYSPQPNSLRGQTVNGIRYTDCSDSVSAAYSAAGCFPVGNTTAAMYPIAQTFSSAAILKAGYLLVNIGQSPHVVMCMNDGCAQVIEAPGTGKPISIKGGSYFDSKTGDWANAKVIQAGSYCGSC